MRTKIYIQLLMLWVGFSSHLSSQCTHPDYDALIEIYQALGGNQWSNNNGWRDGLTGSNCDPCKGWTGVGCSNGRVSSLVLLEDSNAQGILPSSIDNLDQLSILVIRSSKVTGQIPKEIGNLTKLNLLNLADCNLTGVIPKEVGKLSKVTTLNLSNTQISGPIPIEVGNMTNLVVLLLNDTNLSGSFPKELSSIFRLRKIDISQSQLGGSLPEEIGNINFLAELSLHHTNIKSTIPTSINRLVNLKTLRLDHCKLSGIPPVEVFGLRNLSELHLNNNEFSGLLPLDISFGDNLSYLDLSYNKIIGNLPSNVFTKKNISYLNLSNNKFSGIIQIKDKEAISLQSLDLHNNLLTGLVPDVLPDLPSILNISLKNNRLEHCIPLAYAKTCNPITRVNILTGDTELVKINADLSSNTRLPLSGDLNLLCASSEDAFNNQVNLTCDDGFVATKDEKMNIECRCVGKLDTCFYVVRDTIMQLVIDSIITTRTFTGSVSDTLFIDLNVNGSNQLAFKCYTEQWGAFLIIEMVNPIEFVGYTYEILNEANQYLIYDQLEGGRLRQNLDFLEGKGNYTINFRDKNNYIKSSKKLILI